MPGILQGHQKNRKKIEWTKGCDETFQNVKKQLSSPRMLSNPKERETLILYLAVFDYSLIAVLVREENGAELPVYYINKWLADVETRYTSLEKLVYALILAS